MDKQPDDTQLSNLDRDGCLAAFDELNDQIIKALEAEDCAAVSTLVNHRAPLVDLLVKFHKESPYPEDIAQRVVADDTKLRTAVESMKTQMGTELRRVTHHVRSLRKYIQVSEDTQP